MIMMKEKNVHLFFVTNTNATIYIKNSTFSFKSGTFMNISSTSEWGKEGYNGGNVTFTAVNNVIEGNITLDSISTLKLNLNVTKHLLVLLKEMILQVMLI